MKTDVITATSLSDAYSVLAVLTEFPTKDVAMSVVEGSVFQDMAALCDELNMETPALIDAASSAGENGEPGEVYELMRREYTRLFNHPEKPLVPLYEEQFLFDYASPENQPAVKEGLEQARPRLYVNPASIDARRQYRAQGMAQVNERSLPADAMCVQMTFMAKLHQALAEALMEDNETQIAALQDAIGEFEDIHLRKWMADFFRACSEKSQLEVYAAMGQFGVALAKRVLE